LEKLCLRIHQYRGEARFTTWLHRLVVNTCRDVHERQKRRRHDRLGDETWRRCSALVVGDQTDTAIEAAGTRRVLRGALARLSPAQRRVVVLRDVLAWRYDEIADELDLPVGTVKSHAHRAHGALRGRLAPLRKAG